MYRLLIADDEMIERAVLYKMLSKNLEGQCEIYQAENGRQALELYEKEKIQIAVLDIEMPGINGIQVAERIREKDKECVIIFLTAFDEFSYAKKAISVRAIDYVLKPYDENELMLVIEEAMRMVSEQSQRKEMDKAFQNEPEQGDSDFEEENPVPPEDDNVHMSRVSAMIRSFIEENYMYDISMQELARRMNYSEPYFCKLFKQCFNQNFTAYLTGYRIAEAKKLLEQPTVNVKDVGKAVGYSDSNYFTKVFRRITGQSPTEYRNG